MSEPQWASANSGWSQAFHWPATAEFRSAEGADLGIGQEILTRAALEDEFETASGRYFDNDSGRFASPHPDALDPRKSEQIVRAI